MLAPLLTGCGSEPELGTAPVAQLHGAWHLTNRAADCEYTLATFGHAGFFKLFNDNRPRQKYFDIKQFGVGVGFVVLDVENLALEPNTQLKMKLAVENDALKLTDLTTMEGASFKSPPAGTPPALTAHMKDVYRLAEAKFTMKRCPASA